MKNKITKIFSLFMLFIASYFLLGIVEGADLPDYIKKQAHSEKECGVKVIKDSNIKDIENLKSNPEYAKILVLQTTFQKFPQEMIEPIMTWVRENGGTLWVYDSRLAEYFGMVSSPINPDGTLSKDIVGDLGSHKTPGKAIIASAFGSHPVLSGVNGAVVFVVKIDEEKFSAVKTGGGTTALLKYKLSEDDAVCAIRTEGKGKVILKPLLWPDQLDGLRFQTNIMEYSAGFPVPVITLKDSPITDEMLIPNKSADDWKEVDMVELYDGRLVWGKINNKDFYFEGIVKGRKIKKDEISDITFNDKKSGLDIVVLKDGKKEKGLLSLSVDGVNFKTPSGKTVKIGKKEIKKIIFNSNREKKAEEND